MTEIYSSAQAAEMLGVSPNTLRTWKARKSELLLEGQHWITQDGQTYWTQIGVETLQHLRGESPIDSDPKRQPIQDESPSVAARYEDLIDAVADALTPTLLNRLDNAVMGRVKRAVSTPMSATERVTLLTSLGLKPASPELLLQQSSTNYLPEGE